MTLSPSREERDLKVRLDHIPTLPTDTVRSFMKRSKLGPYNEELRAQQEAEAAQRLSEEKAQASAISVGSRCEVRAPGQSLRRGTVMYVGTCLFVTVTRNLIDIKERCLLAHSPRVQRIAIWPRACGPSITEEVVFSRGGKGQGRIHSQTYTQVFQLRPTSCCFQILYF